jgi:hypothetical protein
LFEIDCEIKKKDEFNFSKMLDQIADVTGKVSSISENVSNRIESIASLRIQVKDAVTTATAVGAAATVVGATVTTRVKELAGEIAAAGGAAASAIVSLTAAVSNIENYTNSGEFLSKDQYEVWIETYLSSFLKVCLPILTLAQPQILKNLFLITTTPMQMFLL